MLARLRPLFLLAIARAYITGKVSDFFQSVLFRVRCTLRQNVLNKSLTKFSFLFRMFDLARSRAPNSGYGPKKFPGRIVGKCIVNFFCLILVPVRDSGRSNIHRVCMLGKFLFSLGGGPKLRLGHGFVIKHFRFFFSFTTSLKATLFGSYSKLWSYLAYSPSWGSRSRGQIYMGPLEVMPAKPPIPSCRASSTIDEKYCLIKIVRR